jgi:hypothetical protein
MTFYHASHIADVWPASPFWLVFFDGEAEWLGCFDRFVDLMHFIIAQRMTPNPVEIRTIYEDGAILLSHEYSAELEAVINGVKETLRKMNGVQE